MNKLLLTTVMTMLAAGCVIHTTDRDHGGGDGGGGTVDVAAISARWALRNMADGDTTACPAGFDTVQLFVQPIDERGNALGDPAIDLFDCNGQKGESTDLAPDVYQVWIELRSHDLKRLYAQSLSQILDVRQSDQAFSTDILNDGGYFQLSWDLVARSTNRPLECKQVAGLGTIRAISTNIADAHVSYDDELVCEDHSAVTGGLLQGSYMITFDAMAGDVSAGQATTLTSKTILGQNAITDLGTITIPINGL